jgi:hypothetical protein
MIETGSGVVNVTDFNPIPHDNSGHMGNWTGDYIRMSALDEDGFFIRSFYSNLSGNEEPFIEVEYVSSDPSYAPPATIVISNPSGLDIGLDNETDVYPISADPASLTQYCIEIGYDNYDPNTLTSISSSFFRYVWGNEGWTLESPDLQIPDQIQPHYGSINDVASNVECNLASTSYNPDWTTDFDPQLRIYKDAVGNHYVKPNEALELGDINEGNYQLQFDFLHNPFYVLGSVVPAEKYYFYITEVSPSRKEVRLVTRNGADARVPIVDVNTGEMSPDENWVQRIEGTEEFPGALFNHNFSFVLVVSRARNIPITNYKIDKISDPVNPSLILKLYSPLPTDIARLANVTIEQEIFTTQIENISYRTEAYIEYVDGFGLDYTGGFLGIGDVG